MKGEGLALPCVLQRDGELSTVFTKAEMDGFAGDHAKFEAALEKKLGQ